MLELHTLKASRGARTKKFRIGRGNASGSGTTAGRGTKGQRARTGGRKKLKLRGLRAMFLSFPKSRGFKSGYVKPEIVSVELLAKSFAAPGIVDLKALKRKGLVSKRALSAKIVDGGEIKVALRLMDVAATAGAAKKITAAGGALEKARQKKSK